MSSPGDLAAFVLAVEKGGFSPAARELGLTPSAISKLMTRMEDRLGVRLLNRTTRRLSLTSEGEAFYRRALRILADIAEAEDEVARSRDQPQGRLRVNVGHAFGAHQLVPALPAFLARYPDIEVEITMTDRVVDLVEEGADLGIRSGHLSDSSLVARRICEMERVICAAPAYLERRGTPRKPGELLRHNCLVISNNPALRRWPFVVEGEVRAIEVSGNATANNADTLLQLALLGAGIIRLADVIVGDAISRGLLVPVLAGQHHREPLPLHAVYPQGRHRPPRVAAFVDFLVEHFAGAPWRVRKAGR